MSGKLVCSTQAPAGSHNIQTMGDTTLCGVGMTLEPPEPCPGCFCYVAEIKHGGAVHQSGRVAVGDQLVRIDGFDCMGQARHEIKQRVMGPEGTNIVLEFKRAGQDTFEVKLLRMVSPTAAAGKEHPQGVSDASQLLPCLRNSSSACSSTSGEQAVATTEQESGSAKQGITSPSAALKAAAEQGAADAKAAAKARAVWDLTHSHLAATATMQTQRQQDECDATTAEDKGRENEHTAGQDKTLNNGTKKIGDGKKIWTATRQEWKKSEANQNQEIDMQLTVNEHHEKSGAEKGAAVAKVVVNLDDSAREDMQQKEVIKAQMMHAKREAILIPIRDPTLPILPREVPSVIQNVPRQFPLFVAPLEEIQKKKKIYGGLDKAGAQVGIVYKQQPKGLLIIGFKAGSDASKSELRVGDLIFQVEENFLAGLPASEAFELMAGGMLTPVELTVSRRVQDVTNRIVTEIIRDVPALPKKASVGFDFKVEAQGVRVVKVHEKTR